MSDIKQQLKEQIIEELNLQGVSPGDIDSSAPLFGEGLELDSIDALELVVIMDNFHGVKISDESVGKEVLYSIDTMADFILKYQEEN